MMVYGELGVVPLDVDNKKSYVDILGKVVFKR